MLKALLTTISLLSMAESALAGVSGGTNFVAEGFGDYLGMSPEEYAKYMREQAKIELERRAASSAHSIAPRAPVGNEAQAARR